jgi:hypothetical protein
MVTRLAAVAAVGPMATLRAAPSALPLLAWPAWFLPLLLPGPHLLRILRRNYGRDLGAEYQPSELFEMMLVSDIGTPIDSSITMTLLASAYES